MHSNKKSANKSNVILITAFLLLLVFVMQFTGAWFTDVATAGKDPVVIVFGKIDVRAEVVEKVSTPYIVSPQEIVPGNSKIYRTLKVICPSDSENFYIKVNSTFKIGNEVSDLFKVEIAETEGNNYWDSYSSIANYDLSNWKIGKDNAYYFNTSLKKSTQKGQDAIYYVPLQFTVSDDIGRDVINNQNCSMKIEIEVIQEANNGYEDWQDRPLNWPSK